MMENDAVQVTIGLAGLSVLIREVAWFVKTMRQKNGKGNGAMDRSFDQLTENLERLNCKMEATHASVEKILTHCEFHIRTLEPRRTSERDRD